MGADPDPFLQGFAPKPELSGATDQGTFGVPGILVLMGCPGMSVRQGERAVILVLQGENKVNVSKTCEMS